MLSTTQAIAAYGLPLTMIWTLYAWTRRRSHVQSHAVREAAKEAGLFEPSSLHPVFDPALCRGCGACVKACPEGDVIGIINGKAALIEPSQCIGHGVCKASCPFGAIALVFGTATRGVDIPSVSTDFESNVPGVFIAGELGGMGLIRNAIEQGKQAVETIASRARAKRRDGLDLIIIGAGPAGISASLAAKESHLRFVTIEQDSLGGTVSHFPRGKVVMTSPATLPIVGAINFRETTKETLLGFWQNVVTKYRLPIRFEERVEQVARSPGGFEVTTSKGRYASGNILLAICRRGTPRPLGVAGEELPKVVYKLSDPSQYRGRRVLVVGGGDSALEAAVSIAEEKGASVTLSYRGDGFSRAKMKNRDLADGAAAAGRLAILLGSQVRRITPQSVVIEQHGRVVEIANDDVIVCAGGIMPTAFLKSIGIEIETKHGTA